MARLITSNPTLLRRRHCVALAAALVLMNIASLALVVGITLRKRIAAETRLDWVLAAKVLRVGATLDYPPFSFRCADGSAAGADIDMVRLLAKSLDDADVEIVPTTWPLLLADAVADKFDIAVGGISLTLARLRHVGFSASISHGGKVVVALCGSPLLDSPIATLSASSTAVVVNPGGTNAAFVAQMLPHASVKIVAQNEQWSHLLSGTANLTITDDTEARLQALSHPGELCAGELLRTHESKSYLVPRRDDVPWKAYIDAWLMSGGGAGEGALADYGELVQRWLVAVARNGTTCASL